MLLTPFRLWTPILRSTPKCYLPAAATTARSTQFPRFISTTHARKNSTGMSDKPEGTKDMAQRPPYQHRSAEDFGEVKWHGKCQCGQVKYKLNKEKPLKTKFCHCRGCQKTHAAPFQWAAIFKKENLLFEKGAEGLAFYSSTNKTREYSLPTKVFCSWCRSPIMDEGRNVCLLFPESIECGDTDAERLEWRKAFEVDCHIFYSQRVLEIPDGKLKWAGMDEDSEKVDDMGKPTE